jgi:hypothetical protein
MYGENEDRHRRPRDPRPQLLQARQRLLGLHLELNPERLSESLDDDFHIPHAGSGKSKTAA